MQNADASALMILSIGRKKLRRSWLGILILALARPTFEASLDEETEHATSK